MNERPLMDRVIELCGVYEWLKHRDINFQDTKEFDYIFVLRRGNQISSISSGLKPLSVLIKMIAVRYLSDPKINEVCPPATFADVVACDVLKMITQRLNKEGDNTDGGNTMEE